MKQVRMVRKLEPLRLDSRYEETKGYVDCKDKETVIHIADVGSTLFTETLNKLYEDKKEEIDELPFLQITYQGDIN
ncbi:hypothetical protein P9X10_01270 [Bacillus cereus]|nr:hypothetical protein [Bacillus cereus]